MLWGPSCRAHSSWPPSAATVARSAAYINVLAEVRALSIHGLDVQKIYQYLVDQAVGLHHHGAQTGDRSLVAKALAYRQAAQTILSRAGIAGPAPAVGPA